MQKKYQLNNNNPQRDANFYNFNNQFQLPPTNINNYQDNLIGANSMFTKIYLGQLPLQITQKDIIEAFQQHCQLTQIKQCTLVQRIVKGNVQGQFARYCYAFLSIKGNQSFSNDVIKLIHLKYPNWRINVRSDYQKLQNKPRQQYQNNPRQEFQNNPQQPRYHPNDNFQPPQNFNYPLNFNNRNIVSHNQGQKGIKTHKIFVRQIWLGGIPQGISQPTMREVMGYFGVIQSLEIFLKFAFVKYKLASDATTAFQKASYIHEQFGKSPGFRIFFSDPQKRTNIVSNHYQFDRQSDYLPILFLGFPPITSSFVDQVYMRSIGEKYGVIVDSYMKKNNNPQTRSYILLTFANIKNALKAKHQLSRRRQLLGDKRVEVALLLDQESLLKGRNLQSTIQKFQSTNSYYEKRPPKNANIGGNSNFNNAFQKQQMQMPMQNMYMPHPGYPQFNPNNPMNSMNSMNMNPMNANNPMNHMMPNQMGMNPMMPFFPMMMENNGMRNSGYYYPQQQEQFQKYTNQSEDVVKIIESVLNKSKNEQVTKQKQNDPKQYEKRYSHTEGPSWSGFLIRNKGNRVGADGYSKIQKFSFDEIMINLSSTIKLEDLKWKNEKSLMILEPSNETQKKGFEQYINYLKKKQSAGVSIFYQELLLILTKSQQSDKIEEINQHQLLVLKQDISYYHQIKDKLQKIQEEL